MQKNSKIIKNATKKKNQKITELLQIRDSMISNNINNDTIKKFVEDQYKIINSEYDKIINKKIDKVKVINTKRKEALEFLIKNKTFLELNKASPEYIRDYVQRQYEDINRTYIVENEIDFID